jgi:hypothetical protein
MGKKCLCRVARKHSNGHFSFKLLMEEQIGKLTTINMGVKSVVLRNDHDVKDLCNF